MTRKLFFTVALLATGNIAYADITAQDIANDLVSQGYTRVELRQGPSQIKAEAIRGTEKLEVIYDIASGSVLKTEVETVQAGENTAAGVTLRNRRSDFVRTAARGDDRSENGDDRGRGRGRGSDDDRDHNRGSDDDNDDDHDDDNGDDDSDHDDDHGGRDSDDDDHDDDRGGRGSDDD